MAQNPWAVDSIKAFYFLKCPECDFDTKEENSFETHATKNHPLSLVLFGKKSINEDFDSIYIKEEPLSHSDTLISEDTQISYVDNKIFLKSSVTEDNSMLDVHELKQEPKNKLHVDDEMMDEQSDINTAHC